MAKNEQVKANDIVSAPKQKPMILPNYRPLPKFGSGCKTC